MSNLSRKITTTLRLLPLILLGLLSASAAYAQNDPLFTQHWALPTLYNPAATGDTDWLRIRGAGRLQWIGITNAPKSFVATADMPFKVFNKRVGAGVTMLQESIGLFSNLLISAQGATSSNSSRDNSASGCNSATTTLVSVPPMPTYPTMTIITNRKIPPFRSRISPETH